MEIDELIEQAKEKGMPEVAAVLTFTRDNGTDATIRLLATADRHANAGMFRRLRTEGPLDEAVARLKYGRRGRWFQEDNQPWLRLDEVRQVELAAAGGKHFKS